MERLSCGVMQDLLISYSDGLTGESVTEMLQEHLEECPKCSQRYEEIKMQRETENKEEIQKANKFWNKLRSIRYYIIGVIIGLFLPIVALLVIGLLRAAITYLQTYVFGYFLWGGM